MDIYVHTHTRVHNAHMYTTGATGTGQARRTEDERRPNDAGSCGRTSFSKDERDGPTLAGASVPDALLIGCPLRIGKTDEI